MITLTKFDEQKAIVSDVVKNNNMDPKQKAQVVVCMDISGSMTDLYNNGDVQSLLDRLVPIAMQFDDNQEFELYLFQSDAKKHKNNISLKNIDGLVNREILGHYEFGGTNYAPAINLILEDYTTTEKKAGGFFSALKKSTHEKISGPLDYPVYVIYITDGESYDHDETTRAITEASKYGIFFQFIGIGGAQMDFLEELDEMKGRFVDNANYFRAKNIKAMTDTELYSKMLAEFPSWLQLAKGKNLIK